MYFYILLKRRKVNLTDVYNASVNYDIPNTHKNNLHMVLYKNGLEITLKKQTKLQILILILNHTFITFF
jgi:hypothetical protein